MNDRTGCLVVFLLLACAGASMAASYGSGLRYGTKDYEESLEASITRQETHTFPNFTICGMMCAVRCSTTNVYIHNDKPQQMFMCTKLKPPKATFMGQLRSSSFMWVLVGLGGLVVFILFVLCCCYGCSSCCRSMHTNNSRGSSKDALHNGGDDGFREFLTDDVSAAKKDRENFAEHRGREVNV